MLFIYDLSEDKSGFDGLIIDTVFLGTGNSLQGVSAPENEGRHKLLQSFLRGIPYSFLRKKMQWKDQQRPTLRRGGAHHFMQRWEENHWELRGGKFGSVSSRPPCLLASLFSLRFPPPYQWIQYSGFNTSSQENSIALQAIRLWEWRG